jgi:hypothetical protein
MRLRAERAISLYLAITETRRQFPGMQNKMADSSVFYEIWGFSVGEIHVVVLWIMTLGNIIGGFQCLGGTDCLHLQGGIDDDILTS